MATPLVPLINGYRHSWASIEMKVLGRIITGVTEISYKNTVESEEVRGAGRQVLGETEGDLASEASMTLHKEDYYALLDALAPDKTGAFDARFTVVVSYTAPNNRTYTDTILGARIKEGDHSHSRGTEGLTVTCPLSCRGILENGHRVIGGLNL